MIDPAPYAGPERRTHMPAQLTEEQVDAIAERAAKKAVELMTRDAYAAVGRSVVQKALWVIGVLAVAAYVWASQHGLIKT